MLQTLLLTIITMITILHKFPTANFSFKPDPKVCSTEVCHRTAVAILSGMDKTVDPCHDFYQFTCGNYLKKAKIPPGQDQTGSFFNAELRLRDQLIDILNTYELKPEETGAIANAVRLYRGCMKSDKNEKANLSLLRRLLKKYLGGWPVVEANWTEIDFDPFIAMAKLTREMSMENSLKPEVIIDLKNNTKYMLALSSSGDSSTLNNKYFRKTTRKQNATEKIDFKRLSRILRIKKVISIIFTEEEEKNNPQFFKDVATIAILLGINDNEKGSSTSSIHTSEFYHMSKLLGKDPPVSKKNDSLAVDDLYLSITDLNKLAPQVNWRKYFKILFARTDFKITEDFKIMSKPTNLQTTVELIQSLPKRIIALLMGWNLIAKWGPILSAKLRDSLTENYKMDGKCMEFVKETMGYAVGKMYNDKHVSKAAIVETKKIIQDLKKSFKDLLKNVTWMDQRTKLRAKRKIENMDETVAEFEWTTDSQKLNTYYEKLGKIKVSNFRNAFKKTRNFNFEKKVSLLNKKVNSMDGLSISTTAQTYAMYSPKTNFIHCGSGILQFPFYETGRPRALNYGSFGFIAAHEITHGFDTTGRVRNETGAPEDWWSSESENNFVKKAFCFYKQYSLIKEPVTGKFLNGLKTLSDNIADNGGIRSAFKAYKELSSLEGGRLVGLQDYSEDQLFFISAAMTWCTKTKRSYLRQQIGSDEHSPNKYRTLVPLQNSEDFSRAFKCPIVSRMNPRVKCRIW